MTTRRWILAVILALLVAIGIGIIYMLSSLDAVVAKAIEHYGSQATNTEVTVSSVNIALRNGKAAIGRLTVGNPPGYSQPYAFSLGKISTQINTSSILGDPIIIENINVKAPQVFYEVNQKGQSNILEIENNITSKKPSEQKPSKEPGAKRKFIIRKLVIEKGRIEGSVAGLEQEKLAADLPPIEMTGLGEKTNGASPEEIAKEILSVVAERAAAAAAQTGIQKYLGKTPEQLEQELKRGGEEQLRQLLPKVPMPSQ